MLTTGWLSGSVRLKQDSRFPGTAEQVKCLNTAYKKAPEKEALVGMTGLEPATSSSRITPVA